MAQRRQTAPATAVSVPASTADPTSIPLAPPTPPSPLRILRLTAENIMRLSAIDLRPDGATLVIGGENGAGKSSVLNAIWFALGGKDALPPEPLRKGADRGYAEVDLGDFLVRRTFTAAGGTSLTVKSREGATYPSPQALLNSLIGRLSFDPLAFSRMPPRDQATMLRELVGLDFSDLDRSRAEFYAERTEVNREVSRLTAQLGALPTAPDPAPAEVSIADLVRETEEANRRHREAEAAQRHAIEAKRLATSVDAALVAARDAVAQAQRALEQATANANYAHEQSALAEGEAAQAATDLPDLVALSTRLASAEETNRLARAAKARVQVSFDLDAKRAESEGLSALISSIDSTKAEQLASAPFPVAGLGFAEDDGSSGAVADLTVTYNGIPLSQASSTEQLRVSLAIGAALNPKLRTLLVRDASLLTPKSRADLLRWAEECGMQLIVELATADPGECTVLIEDGAQK